MAELTGAAAYIRWVTTEGTAVLSTDYRTFDNENTIKSVSKAAGADVYDTFLPTLKDGSISSTFLHDGGTAYWTLLGAGKGGTLTWGEAGTANDTPKHTQGHFIERSKMTMKFDDIEIWDITFKPTTARTDGVWASGS
jgi:hypothetical protein